MVAKLSVSLSEELTAVLDELARRRGDDRSPLIETLLRENPIVQEGVCAWRKGLWEPPTDGPAPRDGPETRQRILEIVRDDPGIDSERMRRQLGLAWSAISYHLKVLEKERALRLDRHGRSAHAYPTAQDRTQPPKEVPRGSVPP